MSNEIKLLAALCLARSSVAAKAAAFVPTTSLDWSLFMDLGERNAVVPLVVRRCEELGLMPPDGARWAAWLKWRAAAMRDGQARHEWALKAFARLSQAGIPVIVLKGGLFGVELYGDASYKKMNDVDILLREEDMERALPLLESVGFRSAGDLFKTEGKKAKNHHTPPYYSPDHKCMLGIHWNLASPYVPWKPEITGVWKRAVPSVIPGAMRMSWEDNLVHLCMHLPFLKTGMRELADVYNVVLFAEPDFTMVDELTRAWKAEDAVYRVMSLARALMPFEIPPAMMTRWREEASSLTRRDTEKKVATPMALARSRSTIVGAIERQATILRLSDAPSERIVAFCKKWAIFLLPPPLEAEKLANATAPLGFFAMTVARLRAPARLWRAMARDYGLVALLAMTVINAVLFVKALAAVFVGKRGARLSEAERRMVEAAE